MSPSGDGASSSPGSDDPAQPDETGDSSGRNGYDERDSGDGSTGDSDSPAGGTGRVDPADDPGPTRRRGRDGSDGESFGWREFTFDVLSSVAAVFAVGLLLFATSGVWPPLVAIESPSMDPHMKTGDLVFVMEETRFPGENAHGETGVVTARNASADYRKFEQRGDVIIYERNGKSQTTPIIHRAMFWVNGSENWYGKADPAYNRADSCSEMVHCPAPHGGFITLGDNNRVYDQLRSDIEPVRPAWVVGTAEVRIPALGWVRLRSGRGLGVDAAVTGTETPTEEPRRALTATTTPEKASERANRTASRGEGPTATAGG